MIIVDIKRNTINEIYAHHTVLQKIENTKFGKSTQF